MVVYWSVIQAVTADWFATQAKINPGDRFGRLTVIEVYAKAAGYRCKCRCDCGEEVDLPAAHLRSDRAKSCGCYWRERAGSSPKRGH